MSKQLYFFVTNDVLIQILCEVSKAIPVKYIENRGYEYPRSIEYTDLSTFPDFGFNSSGDQQNSMFLVVQQDKDIVFEKVEQISGGELYFVGQNLNPDSIALWPGGIYNGNCLISGHISTISDSGFSKELFKIFQKNIKKRCKQKVGRYYIDDVLLGTMSYRLVTMNINEPKEYDIQLPQK